MNAARAIILLLTLVLALPGALAAPPLPLDDDATLVDGYHQYLPAERLDIFGKVEADVSNLAMLTRLCAHEVDAFFGDGRRPEHRLNFYAMDISFLESDFKSWDVPLRTAAPLEASVVRILQGLLLRQLRERLGIKRAAAPASVAFLAAALANRIVYDGKGTKGLYRKDYRIPRRQFASGTYPDLTRLLTEPPPSESRLLYRLYLVHCDLLLSCLQGLHSQKMLPLVLEWWRLECKERLETTTALAQAMGIPKDKLQEWYVTNAASYVKKSITPESAEDIASRLHRILTIPVVEMGGDEPLRTVPLEKLPEILKNRPLDLYALDSVQKDLLQLKLGSPPIYHDAIDLYIMAVNVLRQNDLKAFRKRFAEAQKSFGQATRLQQRVTALLNEAERELSPVDIFRAATWQNILEHRLKLRAPVDRTVGFPQ